MHSIESKEGGASSSDLKVGASAPKGGELNGKLRFTCCSIIRQDIYQMIKIRYLYLQCKTTFKDRVTKKENVRRYSQIEGMYCIVELCVNVKSL